MWHCRCDLHPEGEVKVTVTRPSCRELCSPAGPQRLHNRAVNWSRVLLKYMRWVLCLCHSPRHRVTNNTGEACQPSIVFPKTLALECTQQIEHRDRWWVCSEANAASWNNHIFEDLPVCIGDPQIEHHVRCCGGKEEPESVHMEGDDRT